MIPLLEKACEENDKISIQLETTATTILTDENGKAVGVKAVGATGNEVTVNAKAVILATGGFARIWTWWRSSCPHSRAL